MSSSTVKNKVAVLGIAYLEYRFQWGVLQKSLLLTYEFGNGPFIK